ncbi:MAG: hypothetical protein QM648_03115 [Solirubrobacterales bacterium]
MPAEPRAVAPSIIRLLSAIALIALAVTAAGCGGSEVQTTPTSLEKPALAVPDGSIDTSASKKSGSTGSTSSTTSDSSSDSSDTGTDTGGDTGGADTGGADTGAGTGTGTDTGGADTGGAGPGN